MVGALLLLQTLASRADRATRRLVLIGNGGGASVLAADALGRLKFTLARYAAETRTRIEALQLPDGVSIENPIDIPANVLSRSDGKVVAALIETLGQDADVDAILVHLNLPVITSYAESNMFDNVLAALITHRKQMSTGAHLLLLLRSDGTPELEAVRASARLRAAAAGVPVFDDFAAALGALSVFSAYEGRSVTSASRN
jgi:acyl-CoA synthetase (NDP forming)